MKEMDLFQRAVNELGQQYREGGDCQCPDSASLYDAVCGEPVTERGGGHLSSCESCRMSATRLEDEMWLWETALDLYPDKTLAAMLGEKGVEIVTGMQRSDPQVSGIFSSLKEQVVMFVSPLWQPMLTGSMITATELVVQKNRFAMEYGEYVELSCQWHMEGEGGQIDLEWQANISELSNIFVQFVDPQTENLLARVCLGTDLTGHVRLTGKELTFHPFEQKWALSVVVEHV